jgi:uncharacterized protein
VRFWDASAIVPLLVTEDGSAQIEDIEAQDPAITIWWGTPVECVSAFARLRREGALGAPEMAEAMAGLRRRAAGWAQVVPTAAVREQAIRLVRVHELRSADALQLAAAIVAADFQPASLPFVTLDTRQGEAADKEGFQIVA